MEPLDVEIFATDQATSRECLQVAPMGGNRVAVLFLLSDATYAVTLSVIFVVDDFDPATARGILLTSEWLMSLSAAPTGQLFALEATTWVWRYDGTDWTRDRVGPENLRRIWAKDAGGPIVFGTEGAAYRLEGATWVPIPPLAPVQYLDLHGRPDTGLYICGGNGSLHRLGATGWVPLELYRGGQFRGIEVAPDGTIRLAGDEGTCLRIAGEEVVEIENSGHTQFTVRSYKGETYWGDEVGVYIERDTVLEPFEPTGIGYDLRTDTDFLYLAGTDTAWRFDGRSWKTLRLVYDGGFRLV